MSDTQQMTFRVDVHDGQGVISINGYVVTDQEAMTLMRDVEVALEWAKVVRNRNLALGFTEALPPVTE